MKTLFLKKVAIQFKNSRSESWSLEKSFESELFWSNSKKMVEMKNLFGTIARSTSAPAGYDQIDDTSEGRLKVHAEEAFKAGIKFKARFIGSLEIPKVPNQIISSSLATK